MATLFVKCKTEDCGARIAPPQQVPEDKLEESLHPNNYYLCFKCGQVGLYTKEDHYYE